MTIIGKVTWSHYIVELAGKQTNILQEYIFKYMEFPGSEIIFRESIPIILSWQLSSVINNFRKIIAVTLDCYW